MHDVPIEKTNAALYHSAIILLSSCLLFRLPRDRYENTVAAFYWLVGRLVNERLILAIQPAPTTIIVIERFHQKNFDLKEQPELTNTQKHKCEIVVRN